MTKEASDFVTYTEAQQKAKALGATVQGIYWRKRPDKDVKERFSVHYYRPDGVEVADWCYNTGIFTKLPPREPYSAWYEQLEKEILE